MNTNNLITKPYLILALIFLCFISAFPECEEKPGTNELLQDRLDSVTSSTLIPVQLAIYLPSSDTNIVIPKDSVMEKLSLKSELNQDTGVTLDWVLSNLVTKYELFSRNNPEEKLDTIVSGGGSSLWGPDGDPIMASKETILTMLNQCDDYIASIHLWIDEDNANSVLFNKRSLEPIKGQRKKFSIDGKVNHKIRKSEVIFME